MGHYIHTLKSSDPFRWTQDQHDRFDLEVNLSSNEKWKEFYKKTENSRKGGISESIFNSFFTDQYLLERLWGDLGFCMFSDAKYLSAHPIVNHKIRAALWQSYRKIRDAVKKASDMVLQNKIPQLDEETVLASTSRMAVIQQATQSTTSQDASSSYSQPSPPSSDLHFSNTPFSSHGAENSTNQAVELENANFIAESNSNDLAGSQIPTHSNSTASTYNVNRNSPVDGGLSANAQADSFESLSAIDRDIEELE